MLQLSELIERFENHAQEMTGIKAFLDVDTGTVETAIVVITSSPTPAGQACLCATMM
jgi:hypothetical protein